MEEQSLIWMTESLNTRSPLLLLGAGFSLGAINQAGKPLPKAWELSNELFDNLLTSAHLDSKDLDELRKHRDNLQYICTALADEGLTDKRNEYLVDCMRGCCCNDKDFHILLKEYSWKYIFTLNIDDLVEYIYRDVDLTIQLNNARKEGNSNAPELIKLHGSVDRPDLGFIFDQYEYRKFAATDNWLLSQFGIEYLKNDVIFLGTEFQEDDLLLIIEKFQRMAGATKDFNYYFVTPEIRNRSLRRRIEQTSNMHHIKFTTEQFLRHIHDNIINAGESRRKIRDFGMIFLDEKKREMPSTYRYNDIANLYLGELPRYQDFFNNWDIRYPRISSFINRTLGESQHLFLTLYGDPYVGKTCVAMRIMVDLLESGFVAGQFDFSYSLDARKYVSLLSGFMETLPEGTKFAIFSENAPYFYDALGRLIRQCPSNVAQFVIISTGNVADHNSKKHLVEDIPFWEEYKVSEKITYEYANNIYNKLNEKGHVNKLRLYGNNRYEIVGYIKDCNDIIDVLYISQEGRSFIDHFSSWLTLKEDNINRMAFAIISCFSLLNIQSIPLPILSDILRSLSMDFSFDFFIKEYAEAIRFQNGTIRLRCNRLLCDVTRITFDMDTYQRIIIAAVHMLATSINDRETSPKSELFQKLLKVKTLAKGCAFSYEEILKLLDCVKEDCKHLSYFWIQYGIANRDLTNFEEANNAFSEAVSIRGHMSYHVQHAQSQNYMAWGIWELDHNTSWASHYFDQGKSQMEELIKYAPHQYFAYSVHTYIDMSLNYLQKARLQITSSEARYMHQQLSNLLPKRRDGYLVSITRKFLSICEGMELDIDFTVLKNYLADRHIGDPEFAYDADMLDDNIEP